MKPKIGDTVQFKKSGIIGTVEKILRGACIVDTHGSKLSAWPEDLIICGLSEVSLDKEMEEYQRICDEIMEIQGIKPIEAEIEEAKTYWDSIKDAWICPEGYQFVDENGNVINATKIVLKKKKEYPKTYEECAEIIAELTGSDCNPKGCMGYMSVQLTALQKLLICRDVYWKIAGDEMGLGKPWEPDFRGVITSYVITVESNKILKSWTTKKQVILAFPTEEMRDAFYENFKSEIESCKELL